jgi:hypothetical protein
VFILNASGVLFTANSRVGVGALVASTFNLTNDDFLKGSYVFTVARGNGSVIAEGDIIIADGGFVALASNHDVRHTGTVNGGDAALFASTDSLTLKLNPSHDTLTNYAIGNLAGATTVGGRINIGSATKGGELLTAGSTVTTDVLTLNTGTGGAWVYDQNDAITIGAGRFTGSFVNDNLNTRSLSLRSREGDITINAAVDWTANTTLGLSAKGDININKPIKATGATAGLVMDYGGDYHLITPATFSGAELDANGKPVAKKIPAGTEFSSVTLNGNNATLRMNGNAYTLIHSMEDFAALSPSNADTTGYFALAGDLDAAAWRLANAGAYAVVNSLSGTLAGLGHTVDKLTLKTSTENAIYGVGLIGRVVANGGKANILRDIGITNVDLYGNGGGALVYHAQDAIISQVYSTGKVNTQGVGAVGGLVGYINGMGLYEASGITPTIEYSYSNAEVTTSGIAGGRAGGLIGAAESIIAIRDSHATGKVSTANPMPFYVIRATGESYPGLDEFGRIQEPPLDDYYVQLTTPNDIGGLAGTISLGDISNSYATGSVNSLHGDRIGGLIGLIKNTGTGTSITSSFSTGDVVGGYMVGGLVGQAMAVTVDNVYATGNVTGTRAYRREMGGDFSLGMNGMVGGLIGQAGATTINNAYATGNVISMAPTGESGFMGSLVGSQDGGTISDSYATGTVVGSDAYGRNAGGLVGGSSRDDFGTVSNSYYQDANVVRAIENAPIRAETGRILDDIQSRESDKTRDNAKDEGGDSAVARRGTYPGLDQFIYSDDGSRYSARVKAISVEDECEDGEDCER